MLASMCASTPTERNPLEIFSDTLLSVRPREQHLQKTSEGLDSIFPYMMLELPIVSLNGGLDSWYSSVVVTYTMRPHLSAPQI